MAISFVNKSAFASGTAALSVGAVSGVTANDLILLFVESANQAVTLPTGFTEVTGSPVSTGTAAAAGGVRLSVYYRFATGADTTTSVADTGDHTTAIKLAYRGVDQTTPFDATAVTGTKGTASTSSSFPGITTTTDNAWVVHGSALDLDAASTATTGTPTNANLTGLTERHDQTVTSGFGGGLVIIDGVKASAGASGNTTATVTSTVQVYLTMALRAEVDIGTMAVTETGTDTFASDGGPIVTGSLAVSETGTDTFASTGSITSGSISGTFAVTETGTDTLSSSGNVIVKGSLAVTETGTDSFSSTGKVIVKGSLAVTETGLDTFYSTGQLSFNTVTGIFSVTEETDSFSASGIIVIRGSFAATEVELDVFQAAQGFSPVSGDLSGTEQADYFGGYVNGYVDGYVGGVSGYLGRIGGMAAVETGGGQTGFGVNAVMKYYTGTTWVILYKDPTVYV
jgi:hypothetical protein